MKVTTVLATAALVMGVSAQSNGSPLAPVPNNLLWPRPQKFTSGTSDHTFSPVGVDITIVAVNGNQGALERAADRFRANVLSVGCDAQSNTGDISQVTVTVTGTDPKDLAQADESYTLNTSASGVTITANHTVGALRGLETLAQLVKPVQKLPFHAGPWSITDKPSYSWRGISLDTSRNYIPVSSILRTLDGMSATKLNVLHWHIVDATSFPVVSKTYPDLSNAAYSKLSIYSYADVQNVIAYAADRGIRVVPEFDTPAHTNALSFSKALAPYILCPNGGAGGTTSFWPTCPEPPCGNVNIADPNAAPAISALVKEYAALFTDSVFHMGGDEIENFCLNQSPQFTDIVFGKGAAVPATGTPAWQKGLASSYQKYADAVRPAGKTAMYWEDIVINDGVTVPAGSIIQIWNSWDNAAQKNSLQKVLDLNSKGAGYKIVDTNNDYYYLDGGSGAWLTDRGFGPGGDSWKEDYWTKYKTWERVYTHDPRKSRQENTTDTDGTGLAGPLVGDLSAIIGAEAAIWGERISDSNLDVKLWPRAAAVAEALWSADAFPDPTAKDFFEALPRLEVFRDRLIARGFGAETFQPAWCRSNQCGAAFSGYPAGLAYGNQKPEFW
ncbi:hypothetical protein BCR33DRAFT_801315 [Rhizoclosmatium globosum]|uniref:Beta-hexosaminidase n=1 Tax=Rhizoclosmatium globosum TaxID=329046 RepID=A0A1Y2D2Z4_9FUNG|nr:hypothetical protein BCR33DRAFT_801315 [Rhizoclosmatium globosum]|eukprot:ORY53659.1 hypothetical protein BCR33DRAFT_801315 [Rhizoclosmatium globosum]